jgi:hypothetical protein
VEGTSKREWENNIGMELMKIGWQGMDWIHLAQNRDIVVSTVVNLQDS